MKQQNHGMDKTGAGIPGIDGRVSAEEYSRLVAGQRGLPLRHTFQNLPERSLPCHVQLQLIPLHEINVPGQQAVGESTESTKSQGDGAAMAKNSEENSRHKTALKKRIVDEKHGSYTRGISGK